jgi:hypothetical protein
LPPGLDRWLAFLLALALVGDPDPPPGPISNPPGEPDEVGVVPVVEGLEEVAAERRTGPRLRGGTSSVREGGDEGVELEVEVEGGEAAGRKTGEAGERRDSSISSEVSRWVE